MKSLESASKKSKERRCIVHYAGLRPYSELKEINKETEGKIRAAGAKRQTLKGRNHDEEQCLLVPDDIQDGVHITHGVHMAPCYWKFTLILAGNHQGNKATSGYQKEVQMVVQLGFIQKYWRFFKKGCLSYRGKRVGIARLGIKEAELLIKQIARGKDPELV